jgi:hypothetical protein
VDWVFGFALLVTALAVGSLYGARVTSRELAQGVCSYEVLAGYTGVFNRKRLEALVGPADASGKYHLAPGRIKTLPRGLLGRFHLDEICIAGAVVSVTLEYLAHPTAAGALLCVCGAYQITCWGYAIFQGMLHANELQHRRF